MILIVITLVICLIVFMGVMYHDKLSFLNIKLKNIEEKINSTLIKRKSLIQDSETIIKEVLNTDKQIYENLTEINNQSINMMELDRKLLIYINEFYLIKDKYKKLQNNENFKQIAYAINETEDKLNAYKEYYNDNAAKYNELIQKFPLNIISFFKKRKEKNFFDQKSINDNDYNDFKY